MNSYRHDYHVHSCFSHDSDASLEAACRVAIDRGLDEIAFTDHVDLGPDFPEDYFRAPEYLAAIARCRARYGEELAVCAAVELGEPHLYPDETAALLDAHDFDFVLGSAHYALGMRAAWREEFFVDPLHEAYESYFRQVVRLAAAGDYDVLAHVDLIKRDARQFGKLYDGPGPYGDMIRTALKSVVERGKGIELNLSPLRRGQPEPCPSLEVLKWYRELGGEILVIGSDAHSPDAVGAHVDLGVEIARSAGFARLATFRERQIDWRRI